MLTPRGNGTPAAPGQDSDLARLITLEQQLSAQLEASRAGDEALVAEARADAAASLTALTRDLDLLTVRLTTEARAATADRIRALEAEGVAACARHDALTDATAARLADDLVRWLLDDGETRP